MATRAHPSTRTRRHRSPATILRLLTRDLAECLDVVPTPGDERARGQREALLHVQSVLRTLRSAG